jgi:glycosyltransferase involved in cell wall biosynthesis
VEWWYPRPPTWSHIAASLLGGMQAEAGKVSLLDAQRSLPGKALLAAVHRPFPSVPWKYSATNLWLTDRAVRRRARRRGVDAVLEVADVVVPTDVPTFVYQDMNFDVALAHRDDLGAAMVSTFPASADLLRRRADRQRARYDELSGVFTFSSWYARWLVERQGVDARRVHVVGTGLNRVPARRRPLDTDGPRNRLLFVGVEFDRKGGDLAVAAVEQLRAGGLDLRLSVVGPPSWPHPQPPPPFVDFLGQLAGPALEAAYPEHDLLVLPSRFEAYGIGVLEATAAGLPVVAPKSYALPELVQDGITGLLVDGLTADNLAETIARALSDDGLYERTAEAAPGVVAHHRWDRVARDMLARMAPASDAALEGAR